MINASTAAALQPPRILERHAAEWRGLRALSIKLTCNEPLEFNCLEQRHFLVALEHTERYGGETNVQGLPKSSRRDLAHKLAFIPAGCAFSGWIKPLASLHATLLYIDPQLLSADAVGGPAEIRPRLYFSDDSIWQTVRKLKAQIGSPHLRDRLYAEQLAAVLAHEIVRLDDGVGEGALPPMRGGLAAWQQRRVVEFIEAHLADEFPLAALAGLVQLSTYHFARAFKRSFGIPPHRYHTNRRIERARALLTDPRTSVAEIAHQVGFSGASAFAATFRRTTGQTPTDYRRALG